MTSYTCIIPQSWMKNSEWNIHNLCNNFAKELYDKEYRMYHEINTWRNELIREINSCADDQQKRLQAEYEKQRGDIEATRRQFIDAALPHENSRNIERINQLIEQCKALTFELLPLEYPVRSIPFIQFLTQEQQTQKKQDEKKTGKSGDSKSQTIATGGFDNANTGNAGASGSGKSNPTYETPNRENRSGPGTNVASAGSTTSSSSAGNNRVLLPKCPTCFMIFPSYMTADERDQHAAEHFAHS